MSNFKHRNDKNIKIDKKVGMTLDNTHKEKLEEFHHNISILAPELEKKKKEFKQQLNNIIKEEKEYILSHGSSNNPKHIKQIKAFQKKKHLLASQINNIRNKLKKIKHEKKEYFLNNSKHIFSYFEEKSNNINEDDNQIVVYSFFNKDLRDKTKQMSEENITHVKKYMRNIDDTNIDMDDYYVDVETCKSCKKGEMVPIEFEGIMVCKLCHKQERYFVDQDKTSYKEPPKEISFFAYKRINHFREILSQFQAKESTKIDDSVIEDIKKQIKKQRLNKADLTNAKTKSILKLLGYNKYYEHIPFIKEKLGIKPPTMSVDLENTLCNLFMEIQKPYAKFCPNERVNFLNYYYVLYKLCEILCQDEYLEQIDLLKDPMKRMEQDEIWKKICNELEWKYYPTE